MNKMSDLSFFLKPLPQIDAPIIGSSNVSLSKKNKSNSPKPANNKVDLDFLLTPLPSLNKKIANLQAKKPSSAGFYNSIQAKEISDLVLKYQGVVGQIFEYKNNRSVPKGTGCLLKGNLLITNHHVIKPC